MEETMLRSNKKSPAMPDFGERLRQVAREYGSRYALAKATSIPASTLQSYEAGSNPGAHALLRLARIANVDLNWLLTGKGQIRPTGLIPGAALADVLMVDQYEIGTAMNMSVIVGQVPYSRHLLETKSGLKEPKLDTLLTVEADADLYHIARGDLVLIDRTQTRLARDGVYLLDLAGITLRAIIRRVGDKVTVVGPELEHVKPFERSRIGRGRDHSGSQEVALGDLHGSGRFNISKIVGRAVRVDRGI
jgi:transcriptional regulator with XRE-family HTH domain